MMFLTLIEEAYLHREIYTAVLDGLLCERGDKRALAEQAGISPQYLSYLLANRPGATRRDPSPATARRLAEALPLAPYERDLLVGHMMLSNQRRLEAQRSAQALCNDAHSAPLLLAELQTLYERANFGPPAQTLSYCKLFAAQATLTLDQMSPSRDPVAYAQISLWLHDVVWQLHYPTEALWRVGLARQAIERYAARRYFDCDHGPLDMLVNAIRNEAVSYSNLGVHALAYQRCRQAEALLSQANTADRAHWLAHVYRDQLNALIGMPRYTLSEAESLANGVARACEADFYEDRDKELLTTLIQASLARAYVRYGGAGNLAKAERLIQREYEHLDHMARLGSLHRIQVLRAYASLRFIQGDRTGWTYFIGLAIQAAYSAGLTHQLHDIQREFDQASRQSHSPG